MIVRSFTFLHPLRIPLREMFERNGSGTRHWKKYDYSISEMLLALSQFTYQPNCIHDTKELNFLHIQSYSPWPRNGLTKFVVGCDLFISVVGVDVPTPIWNPSEHMLAPWSFIMWWTASWKMSLLGSEFMHFRHLILMTSHNRSSQCGLAVNGKVQITIMSPDTESVLWLVCELRAAAYSLAHICFYDFISCPLLRLLSARQRDMISWGFADSKQ